MIGVCHGECAHVRWLLLQQSSPPSTMRSPEDDTSSRGKILNPVPQDAKSPPPQTSKPNFNDDKTVRRVNSQLREVLGRRVYLNVERKESKGGLSRPLNKSGKVWIDGWRWQVIKHPHTPRARTGSEIACW